MKRIILLLLSLIGGGMPTLNAQFTMTIEYYGSSCEEAILRNIPSTGNDIVCREELYSTFPTFFCHHGGNGANNIFVPGTYSGPVYVGFATAYSMNVEDMVVGTTYCYFCGTLHTYTVTIPVDPNGIRTDEYIDRYDGFIARFPLSDLNGSSLSVDYLLIPGTTSLKRLKIDQTTGLLAAVAVSGSSPQGFVILKDDGTTAVSTLLYPTDSHENISDLTFTSSSFVAVSEFDNNDNAFAIRDALSADLVTSLGIGPLHSRYLYNTAAINTTPSPRPSCPTFESTHDLLATSIPSTDRFVVAYEAFGGGFDDECKRDYCNTNIYEISIPYPSPMVPTAPTMITSQLVTLNSAFQKGLQEIKYVPAGSTVALLYKNVTDPYGMSGLIQYPSLATYGQKYSQPTGQSMFLSMDAFSVNQLNLVGRDMTDSHLVHYTQGIGATSSCIPLSWCQTEKMTVMDPESGISEMRSSSVRLEWSYQIIMPSVQIESESTCHTY